MFGLCRRRVGVLVLLLLVVFSRVRRIGRCFALVRLQRKALLDFVFDGVLVEFSVRLFEVEVTDEFQCRTVARAVAVVGIVVGIVARSIVTLAALLLALIACLLLVVAVAAVHAAG